MSKKTLKVISIFTIIVCIIMAISPVFAAGEGAIQPGDIKPNYEGTNTTEFTSFAGKVVGLIRTIGIVASVIILMIIGLKFLMGSAEEKAEYKKSLMPYVIGAVILFGASTIAGFVVNFFK